MKKVLATIAVVFGMSSLAQAGMLIEPYLGYEMGDLKRQEKTEAEFTDKSSGTSFGLRLGYKFLLPWVALDYTSGSGKLKTDDPGKVDSDYKKYSLGGTVGVDLPLIRGWVGYGFQNDLQIDDPTNDVKFKGTYTKFGVGLGFIPFVSLNVEYKINNFDKLDYNGTEYKVDDQFDTLKHDTVMISISAPFNL